MGHRILVVGLPRGGTTWVESVLGSAPGVHTVHEPDNLHNEVMARVGRRTVGMGAALRPGERDRAYELLWDLAFAGGWPAGRGAVLGRAATALTGGPRVPSRLRSAAVEVVARASRRRRVPWPHVLVKTVSATLSAEWLADRYRPSMVIVVRHPLNLVSSWLELGWWNAVPSDAIPAVRERFEDTAVWPPPVTPGPHPGPQTVAWALCALSVILAETANRHPYWHLVEHEHLCSDAEAGFARLFAAAGLDLTAAARHRIAEIDTPGTGLEVTRVRAAEAQRWRERLDPDVARTVRSVADAFAEVSPVAAAIWSRSPAVAAPATGGSDGRGASVA